MAATAAKRICEHPPGVVVHDEVDVALAEAGVDVGEPVPLVGQRAQRLGEQLEAVDLHRQLALAGGHHRAVDADPVAEVEGVERVVRLLPEHAAATRRAARVPDWSRMVANVSLPWRRSSRMRPATRTRTSVSVPGVEVAELGPQLGEGAVAVEADRVRVDAPRPELVEVGQPAGPLGRDVERGRRRPRTCRRAGAGIRPMLGATPAAAAHRFPTTYRGRVAATILTTVDGIRLAAHTHCVAAPRGSVVVAHGFSASATHADVEALAGALGAAGYDVVTYDARGHGDSEGQCTLGDLERHDVAAAVQATNPASGPVVLVGMSMGAIAVLRHAAEQSGSGVRPAAGVVTVSAPRAGSSPGTHAGC